MGRSGLLRPGVLAFAGSIGATDTHAHHAVQIITAATPLTVTDEQGASHTGTNVVVPADAAHRIRAGAQGGTVVFLEPEYAPGRAVHLRAIDSGWAISSAIASTTRRPLATVVAELVADLSPATFEHDVPARHSSVDHALQLLPALVAAGPVRGRVTLGAAWTAAAHL